MGNAGEGIGGLMGRGSYLGGSTIIGPWSYGWFSKNSKPQKKSKPPRVRSMQRGDQKRDRTFVPAQELYKKSPPRLARHEKANFEFGEKRQEQFVESFRDFIGICNKTDLKNQKISLSNLIKMDSKQHVATYGHDALLGFYYHFYIVKNQRAGQKIQYTANPDLALIKKVQKNTGLTDAEVKKRIDAVRKNK